MKKVELINLIIKENNINEITIIPEYLIKTEANIFYKIFLRKKYKIFKSKNLFYLFDDFNILPEKFMSYLKSNIENELSNNNIKYLKFSIVYFWRPELLHYEDSLNVSKFSFIEFKGDKEKLISIFKKYLLPEMLIKLYNDLIETEEKYPITNANLVEGRD